MTRCPEFYERWEKEPNWCEKCQSAVSQIDSYLEWVAELEKAGVDKKITFVKLPEAVARELFKVKEAQRRESTIKNLATYLQQPDSKKIRPDKLRSFILYSQIRDWKPPSYPTKIRRNEKLIEGYRSKIRALEQENVELQRCILRDSRKDVKVPQVRPVPQESVVHAEPVPEQITGEIVTDANGKDRFKQTAPLVKGVPKIANAPSGGPGS